jgi:hypothetical protein
MQKEELISISSRERHPCGGTNFVQVQHIKEKNITWKESKKYFQNKYLTKRYYDKKMKELFELDLGSMTIDEYKRRLL